MEINDNKAEINKQVLDYSVKLLTSTSFGRNLLVSPPPMMISRTMVDEIADNSGDDKIRKVSSSGSIILFN